jgi:hypothetical protein
MHHRNRKYSQFYRSHKEMLAILQIKYFENSINQKMNNGSCHVHFIKFIRLFVLDCDQPSWQVLRRGIDLQPGYIDVRPTNRLCVNILHSFILNSFHLLSCDSSFKCPATSSFKHYPNMIGLFVKLSAQITFINHNLLMLHVCHLVQSTIQVGKKQI